MAKGKAFLNLAHADSPHLSDKLREGAPRLRAIDDNREGVVQETGITPSPLPSPGDFASMIESASEYAAYSGAVHGSVAGWNEIHQAWADPETRPVLLYRMIRATGRAHIRAVSGLSDYVSGDATPKKLGQRVRAFVRELNLEDPLTPDELRGRTTLEAP